MSIAPLRRDQGKPNEAPNILAPVLDWLTESFGTLDLKKAKTLLDEMGS
jgi:hypothetical protein